MATRSPTKHHNYWGNVYLTYADLPNVSAADFTTLEAGDIAYIPSAQLFYVCVDPTPGAAAWTALAGGGGSVTDVTASTPLESSEGATPNISLAAGTNIDDVLAWNGAQWVSSAPPLTRQMLSLNGAATGGTVAYIGGAYFPTGITITAASQAYIGGREVADSTTLSLVAISGGLPLATWTISGTLGVATVASPPIVIPAGWYDLTLQGTAGSGVAFARGLYLA